MSPFTLKSFLSFWREHSDTILDGELTALGIDANYTLAKAQKDGESVAVLYQGVVYNAEKGETAYIFNSTGEDGIYIESKYERDYELYDIFGNKYASGTLGAGVTKIDLKSCEMIKVK